MLKPNIASLPPSYERFPVGAQVVVSDCYGRPTWAGIVDGHPGPFSISMTGADGNMSRFASVSLVRLGAMTNDHPERIYDQLEALSEENAGLLQIIGEQAEALGHMQADRDRLRVIICAMAAVDTWEDAQAAIKRIFGE